MAAVVQQEAALEELVLRGGGTADYRSQLGLAKSTSYTLQAEARLDLEDTHAEPRQGLQARCLQRAQRLGLRHGADAIAQEGSHLGPAGTHRQAQLAMIGNDIRRLAGMQAAELAAASGTAR